MLWELIATFSAGLGAAGIALVLRLLTLKKLPSWIIPVAAGAGMLGYQIVNEYTWFDHQSSLLPAGVKVVRTVEETAAWRPWSYLYPQTMRFLAADIENAARNQRNPEVYLVDLYIFERRMSARRIPQVVHCGKQARADFTDSLEIPMPGAELGAEWFPLDSSDLLYQYLCQE